MDIQVFPIAIFKDNYVWIITNISSNHAIIVDPGDAQPVIQFLESRNLQLVAILITHHHWDHSNGLKQLLNYQSVTVFASQKSPLPLISHYLQHNEFLSLHSRLPAIKTMAIPGHTLDHVAYLIEDKLFCGDTLFGGGCGKIFEGTTEQLFTSLQKIAGLPDTTQIYCGHEYTLQNLRFALNVEPHNTQLWQRLKKVENQRENLLSTLPTLLSEEKNTNIFLRCHEKEIIHSAEEYANRTLKSALEVFTILRQWKNQS